MSAAPQRQRRVGLGTALAVGVAVAAVAAYRSRRGQQLTLALGDYLDAFAAYGDLSKRLSADLHSFLTQPDEPQQQEDGSLRPQPLPESLQQLLRLVQSDEVQRATAAAARAAVSGAMEAGTSEGAAASPAATFAAILEHALNPKTVTLAGALVGSVVRGALTAYYDVQAIRGTSERASGDGGGRGGGGGADVPLPAAARQLVELLVSDPARRLLREVTAAGVATAVTVYVDKTAHLNVTDDVLASLSKPAHRAVVSEVAGAVMGDAVRASVHACHEVLSTPCGSRLAPVTFATVDRPRQFPGCSPRSLQSVRRRLPSTGVDAEQLDATAPYQPNGKRNNSKSNDSHRPPVFAATAMGPSGQMRDLLAVVGAPEVRMLAREVVGSAVWGGVRASYECAQELVPSSWRSAAHAMPPTVLLSCLMALCLHAQTHLS